MSHFKSSKNRSMLLSAASIGLGIMFEGAPVRGQQEIGFVEKFALASDRRVALQELIPGTSDYYYFHCLHYQNERQLAEAQALIDAWRATLGNSQAIDGMQLRQHLLGYAENPVRALQTIREQLGVELNHRPPARDQAAELSSQLDNRELELGKLLEQSTARESNFSELEPHALSLVLDRPLSPNVLRSVLSRLPRADLPNLVAKLAEELKLQDTRGFGWTELHSKLTLAQLEQLLELVPNLLQNDAFVRAVALRLAPTADESLADPAAMRRYLERLRTWTDRLPPSQNSFKALVLGNLLHSDISQGRFDRELFLAYLALPRAAPYYAPYRVQGNRDRLVQFGFSLPEVTLPPIAEDSELVRRCLEYFLQINDNVEPFASYLDQAYLDRVLAETKILYGLGNSATWYAKLSPVEQKKLRERVELRFAPQNAQQFAPKDAVRLQVELKNIEQLIVKVYAVNTLGYYRTRATPIDTSLDLDGLVANFERKFEYTQSAERRHMETLEFPELDQRGVWIIDLLGGGKRSRALIQKGQLIALERLSDTGHLVELVNEAGEPLPTAHLEINGVAFKPNDQGKIVIPYGEQPLTRQLILVDGDFATQSLLLNQAEAYQLQGGFFIDRQALVAGMQAQVIINTRLTCNERPISVSLLEDATLTITATDLDGIATSQTIGQLELEDGGELVHPFLVPQRLATLSFQLKARIYNRSLDLKQDIETSHSLSANGISRTAQIGDIYLRAQPGGYQLLMLGRNGEPMPRRPLTIHTKLKQFINQPQFQLATDENGLVELGPLEHVESLRVTSPGIEATSFDLRSFHRHWPTQIHIAQDETIELPLGQDTAPREQFTLVELRRNTRHSDHTTKLTSENGAIKLIGLTAGDYLLEDHAAGQRVRVSVGGGVKRNEFAVAEHRLLQTGRRVPVVIQSSATEGNELVIRIANADRMTRVHVVGAPFWPVLPATESLRPVFPTLAAQPRTSTRSFYVDSLQLDEEYSYILDRQGTRKFPGNLLPQPTVLINPWEVSVTENTSQQAAAGDALPPMASPMEAFAKQAAEGEGREQPIRLDWKNFDFLAVNARLAANLAVEDGQVRIPIEQLNGLNLLTIMVIHPTSIDSRQVMLPANELMVRDGRLPEAFKAEQQLTQTQRVRVLPAGQKVELGDARTRRLQTYSSIEGVFQLYATLLADPEWEKFRFITNWHKLNDEEKQAQYNKRACHELDFFLYHKDQPFFVRVIRPILEQKLDKQLIDEWLLGRSLEKYTELWRLQRLNTLERILLAEQLQAQRAGAQRWLNNYVAAHPLDAQWRQRRFEAALRGRALENAASSSGRLEFKESANFGGNAPAFGAFAMPGAPLDNAQGQNLARRSRGRANDKAKSEERVAESADAFFDAERLALGDDQPFGRFFQTLDKTREWAETQYYQVRLANQSMTLIPSNPFWLEFLGHNGQPFLSEQLDLPCSNLHEALCALAVLDLPLDGLAPSITVHENQITVEAKSATIAFVESIETSAAADNANSILVGQDIYLAQPSTDEDTNRPVQDEPLLTGTPYRTKVVVTNPTSSTQLVSVLTQLPAGSLPLAGSKLTRSTSLELEAYSTAQVEYFFYFPTAGGFEHYGAQISDRNRHITATESRSLRVLAEPESVNETTWSYIADWGTNAQVLTYLATANLQQIDLSRVAFRMQDKAFFGQVTELLSASGHFEPTLWAYALVHNEPAQIEQLLQNRPELIARLGVVFSSPLIHVQPQEQMSYEHLDYRPLVVARTHRLGPQAKILNAALHAQYHRLLAVMAHQPTISDSQRLSLCYYLLLQNRIEEAMTWFDQVEVASLETKLQHDYFAAYLDFYRGEHVRAAERASGYDNYPIPRWQALFKQVVQQVREQTALMSGESIASEATTSQDAPREQRILQGTREAQQTTAATRSPALDLVHNDGRLVLDYRSIAGIQVKYYLMDIELLFSRNPFVVRGDDSVPVIQPNLSKFVELDASSTRLEIDIPAEISNRNVLVEVTAEGISRSVVITANSLSFNLVERLGWLQVQSASDRAPVVGAYVKVYAQHNDGSVRFYKDGYTDLRGQFDYATLSTSDLDTTTKFAILVLDEKQGAAVREAAPPTR